jgi:hypothetical protein
MRLDARKAVLLRSAIIASVLLGSSLAAAAGPAVVPVKAVVKKAPAKKKAPPPSKGAAVNNGPLTAEQLGLGDYKLSSIKAAEQGESAPPPAAPPPPSPPAAAAAAPEPVAAPPPPPPAAPVPKLELTNKDKVLVPRADAPRRLSIELNPLSIAGGRYGLNVEVAPFVHHVLVGSAYYQTFQPYVLERIMPKAVDSSHGAPAKVGGEVGYRFYSGRRGANGFFIGASGVLMPLVLPRVTPELKAEPASFYAYGGALDVGIQGITDSGFTIGAGVGAMYLAYNAPESAKLPANVPPVKSLEPHFLPRVLLAAGWSF